METKMILVNPLEWIQCDEFYAEVKKLMYLYGSWVEETRYDGFFMYNGKYQDNLYLAVDVPVLIKSMNPIREEKNPTIAIVGEAPSRKDSFAVGESVGITFGQHDISKRYNPRTYDLLIDWYLDKGFDVYITNLSKWIKYWLVKVDHPYNQSLPLWKAGHHEIERDNDKIISCLVEEFKYCKPCHIIWLGDSQWKKFIYGESSKDFFTDYTVFPHPSGANNKPWAKLLNEKSCTKENKVDYMVTHANVLFLGKDGHLESTLSDE